MGLLKDFTPPIVLRAHRASRVPKDALFDGDDSMFKAHVQRATRYGEYGMGASTKWVLNNTALPVTAVDSSEVWVGIVQKANPDPSRLNAVWVDIGPIRKWGYPTGFTHRANFERYRSALWQGPKPDCVLIDGRFRVACFLHTLRQADPGSLIIFDDYRERSHYNVVEEFVEISERCGRQALFVVPERINEAEVRELEDRFAYVVD